MRSAAKCAAELSCWAAAKRLLRLALWDVIDPRCSFRKRWDVLMVLQLVFLVLEVPYVVCFGIQYRPQDPLGVLEIIIDITFVMDIWLSFRTGIVDTRPQVLIADRRVIARRYLSTWFVPDLFTCFPYEWFLQGPAGLLQLLRALRVIKALRMLRLVKLVKISRSSLLMHHIAHALGPHLLQLLKLVLLATTLTHYIACFFYYLARLGSGVKNWVAALHLQDKSDAVKYVTALYWTVSTLGTVGYGDVHIISTKERVIAILTILLGLTVFASFVSSVSKLVEAMDGRASKARRKLQKLDAFLGKRDLPRPLMRRITEFHRHTSARQLAPEELAIVNELSAPLRTELVLFLFRSVLERVPFFSGKGGVFVAAAVPHLRLEHFEEGEVVMRQGESGDHLWFVAHGSLEVRLYHPRTASSAPQRHGEPQRPEPEGRTPAAAAGRRHTAPPAAAGEGTAGGGYDVLGVLQAGDYFGEWSALLGQRRTATVVASSPCECYSLSRASVAAVLTQWPELAAEFEGMLQVQPGESGPSFVPGGVLRLAPHGAMVAQRARSRLQSLAAGNTTQGVTAERWPPGLQDHPRRPNSHQQQIKGKNPWQHHLHPLQPSAAGPQHH
ncbi:potassium voltage-gated channel, subfamily H(eag-related), member 6 [Monoraphidium neglectum]|uniref:Potassium voltage-gated channel, subfamily H(Eag-related), member 6 n=1 Tax=Monoraphidium neglectum TaxID=145388 RepID=A0A0D2N702_9CHLO|nr:potassium voltage-gated channel, subfamily H(eag-related), member 6 [Monoraphidium neglectum]KIZ01636.1 potassium voltage-gated channel, subfamily H(eag-related), member 6 [Monoraphidium neglectum]|eukprot:XP_013900655.1 potassium voltage-gated channel, subfamily H(eag-related), member 6 [Monoraphidium neglectum]